MRYAAAVEYVGSHYSGWQRQKHAASVQGHIEAVLSQIGDAPIETVCAGRTDAGVHALGQVIHFDSDREREPKAWLFGANALLPRDISLRWVCPVDDAFHARFSALGRRYRYVIHDANARSALTDGRVAWSRQPLDAAVMHRAAQPLLGEHDFSAFRAAECQSRTPMRCITHLQVIRSGRWVVIDIGANAFLHHMVRNIAGVLMAVGAGQRTESWPAEVLESRDRCAGGVTAPAEGLYFMHVEYPDRWSLPASPPEGPLLHP